jgi:plastocyanin
MPRVFRAILPVTIVAVAIACGGSDQSKSAKPSSPSGASGGQRVDTAKAGTIKGKVAFQGQAPQNPTISMVSDPVCAGAHKEPPTGQTYMVKDGGLDNVFVYIKDGMGAQYVFDAPTQPVKIDQRGCEYVPHVVGVRVGQPLEITNSDSTMHNVHGMPQTNQEFNYGQPVPGMKNAVTFTAPEVLIPFKCDVHGWMNAYVGVLDHPYFAVTDADGKFDIKTLPPGTYTIEAWHEKLGTTTQQVTIGQKETKEINFTFKATGTPTATN